MTEIAQCEFDDGDRIDVDTKEQRWRLTFSSLDDSGAVRRSTPWMPLSSEPVAASYTTHAKQYLVAVATPEPVRFDSDVDLDIVNSNKGWVAKLETRAAVRVTFLRSEYRFPFRRAQHFIERPRGDYPLNFQTYGWYESDASGGPNRSDAGQPR